VAGPAHARPGPRGAGAGRPAHRRVARTPHRPKASGYLPHLSCDRPPRPNPPLPPRAGARAASPPAPGATAVPLVLGRRARAARVELDAETGGPTGRAAAVEGVRGGGGGGSRGVGGGGVGAAAEPIFRVEDAGSTPGWEPLVIVSGPIAKRLDLNHGQGVMRV